MNKIKRILKSDYISFFIILLIIIFLSYILGLMIYHRNIFNIMKYDIPLQYIHLFNYLRDSIINGTFSLYSFSMGLGSGMIQTYAYYCLSPFNMLLLFSNIHNIPIFLSIIALLKIMAMAFTMKEYLKYKINNSIYSSLFAYFYAFSAYPLLYSSHLMWLDALIMFPLIIYGLEKIVEKNKPVLYIVSLSLCILFNFYISFSICIFSLLYFIAYSIYKKQYKVKTFVLSSLFCGLINMWFLYPTVLGLLDSKAYISVLNLKNVFNYNILEIIPRLFLGNISYINSEETLTFFLNVFSGLLPLLLFCISFLNKKIKKSEKYFYIILIFLTVLISNIKIIDIAMHLFAEPDYYPFRYMFIFSFLIITYGYINVCKIDKGNKKFIIPTLNLLIILSIMYFYKLTNMGILIFVFNIVIIVAYSFEFRYKQKYLEMHILLFALFEIIINTVILYNFKTMDNEHEYKINKYINLTDSIKKMDETLYRVNYSNNGMYLFGSYNDYLSYSIMGIESFFPTIDKNNYIVLIDILGLGDYGIVPPMINRANLTEFTKSFFGIRYELISEKIYKKNEYAFPMLFRVDVFEHTEFDAFLGNSIDNQNQMSLRLYGERIYEKRKYSELKYCECIHGNEKCLDDKKFYIEKVYDNYIVISEISNDLDITQDDYIYILDLDKLLELSKELNNNKVNVEKWYNGYILGNILNEEENQMIFTTIPYDDEWEVKVNGEKIETFKTFDSLLSFKIPKGNLEIEMKYKPKGFIEGFLISVLALILMFIYKLINKRRMESSK